jgi:hypothetical protein
MYVAIAHTHRRRWEYGYPRAHVLHEALATALEKLGIHDLHYAKKDRAGCGDMSPRVRPVVGDFSRLSRFTDCPSAGYFYIVVPLDGKTPWRTTMTTFRRFIKPITHVALLGFLALSLHVPVAQATLIGTDTVVSAGQAHAARDRVNAALTRTDLKQQLAAQGVSAEQVQARVEGMTDQEVVALADKMDQLPAGGDVVGAAVLIFLVLLITDILGYTDIFPFVKKTAR